MVSEPWLTIYYRIVKNLILFIYYQMIIISQKNNIKIVKINSKIYSPLEQFEILFKKPKNCDFFGFKLQRPNPSFQK